MTAGAEGWGGGGSVGTEVGPGRGGDEDFELASAVIELPSRVAGSEGGGPSKAQRRDSYFDRMKDSILLRL